MNKKMFIFVPSTGETKEISSKCNYHFLRHDLSPPQNEGIFKENDGTDGSVYAGQRLLQRMIRCDFVFEGSDIYDQYLIEREIHELFFLDEPYYIYFGRMPGIWYQVIPDNLTITKFGPRNGEFSIEFNNFDGFGKSRGTTLDSFCFEDELRQIGMNLPNGEDIPYIFTGNRFRLFNAGNLNVNPECRHELVIALTCIGTPTLTNVTNGTSFKYNKNLSKADVLLLDGVHAFLNDKKCGRDTDFGYLKLNKGWNEIRLDGCSSITIAFEFRYLYK